MTIANTIETIEMLPKTNRNLMVLKEAVRNCSDAIVLSRYRTLVNASNEMHNLCYRVSENISANCGNI